MTEKQKEYCVYVLQCSDGTLYTGITTDIQRRFSEHKEKKGGGYTQGHTVKKVLYTEKAANRSSALKREAQIKGWTRQKKIEILKLKLR